MTKRHSNYNYCINKQVTAYDSPSEEIHFPSRKKDFIFEGDPGEKEKCLNFIWKQVAKPNSYERKILDEYIKNKFQDCTHLEKDEKNKIVKKWEHLLVYSDVPVTLFLNEFRPRIEFPKLEDEYTPIILRHYLLEEEIDRILELVESFQELYDSEREYTEAEIPDMSEDSFPTIWAIANLFKWAFCKKEIDEVMDSADWGRIEAEFMSDFIVRNHHLEIPDYDMENRYVGHYFAYLDGILVNADFPEVKEYAMAEIIGYKNKFGYSIDSNGVTFETIISKDSYPDDYYFNSSFQSYLDFWRKLE